MKINPSELKITDMRFADIDGAPKRCTLLKLYTNQGLVGFGEVRDASSRTYAAMLKSRILGENPCNVEKIFQQIFNLEENSWVDHRSLGRTDKRMPELPKGREVSSEQP